MDRETFRWMIIITAFAGMVIGFVGGKVFYSERIAVLEERLNLKDDQIYNLRTIMEFTGEGK